MITGYCKIKVINSLWYSYSKDKCDNFFIANNNINMREGRPGEEALPQGEPALTTGGHASERKCKASDELKPATGSGRSDEWKNVTPTSVGATVPAQQPPEGPERAAPEAPPRLPG